MVSSLQCSKPLLCLYDIVIVIVIVVYTFEYLQIYKKICRGPNKQGGVGKFLIINKWMGRNKQGRGWRFGQAVQQSVKYKKLQKI